MTGELQVHGDEMTGPGKRTSPGLAGRSEDPPASTAVGTADELVLHRGDALRKFDNAVQDTERWPDEGATSWTH